ncbi:MAG: hypothetical protein HY556_02810 [Euryarchaeota archaeon]|nr:hypothetical protein [Euryarchaeota archaeon]
MDAFTCPAPNRWGDFIAKLEEKNGALYVDGYKVEKAWESDNGWYWFGVDVSHYQDSLISGEVYPNDRIWFGYVHGHEEEWGHFSETELDLMKPRVWPVEKHDLPYAGRRINKTRA